MDLDNQLNDFRSRVVGTLIRGQKVSDVSLYLETFDGELRYMLFVVFSENPPSDESNPELCLIERVFSEIPSDARVYTFDRDELERWMREPDSATWLLADEMEAK